MTNNWTDIGNASMVLVWGANPSENHPASMAHVNRARDNGATLVVVDPRKTRTAVQADRFIRQRPGTDIALMNGVVRGIIEEMEGRDVADPQRVQFFAFLNQTGDGTFFTDGTATTASTSGTPVPGNSKYTDARFLVLPDGSDYVRDKVLASTGLPTAAGPDSTTISNFPQKATSVVADTNTVYNRLKAHVAPYTPTVVADICGVTEDDITFLVNALIDNSRCSTIGGALGRQNPREVGYKCTTILYAMGITQHTCGSQNVKGFAVFQSLMGNMGRAGGGINALRGIHNVQGSTDMGLLQHLIPFYSGNPSTMTSADSQAFGKYMDSLWGTPLSGSAAKTLMNGSYDDAYNTSTMALQQRGFYNMTRNFFADYYQGATAVHEGWVPASTGVPLPAHRANMDSLWDLWPKVNGQNHITMFRNAGRADGDSARIKAMLIWGQNPAVTEPNQEAIRKGFYNLDTLVVVDMFNTETAAVSRRPGGVTYLIPACAHVEEAGSVSNSGRVLQWRERAALPKGKSKSDIELMLRFAKSLDDHDAFSHIVAVWNAKGWTAATKAYADLYGTRYGWTPTAGVDDFEDLEGTAEIWHGPTVAAGGVDPGPSSTTVYGSEWVAELVYRELNTPSYGTSWLYTGAYSIDLTTNRHTAAVAIPTAVPPVPAGTAQGNWQTKNRSKSRNNTDGNGTLAYPGWGYSWLVNRRVLYNNGDVPGDITDFYMGPDSAARLFVSTNASTLNYSRWYRTIHRMADKPDAGIGTVHVLPGRFPAHTEPYETPRADLAATWGRNTTGNTPNLAGAAAFAQWNCVPSDTQVAGRDVPASGFPFVLTSIRCVEHFQGGPITRNNPWNVEAEPEPWVEINSIDALAMGISDGDQVNVITARGDSMGLTAHDTAYPEIGWAKGFVARVGAGTQGNQRVAPGVVAIPWHWGDQGLSKGSRANDLCIDSGDANTTIPESKACLCNIVKI
ncbi:MAG: molybdopterin-dependent oxidoreductase [Coriobacteriia bacterium]|nr:molybdopterin-dependent oxidoreductase [Coriobacteriia bacterium]